MARQEQKYKRITPLRAVQLLVNSHHSNLNERYRLEQLQNALADHIRASLVKVRR